MPIEVTIEDRTVEVTIDDSTVEVAIESNEVSVDVVGGVVVTTIGSGGGLWGEIDGTLSDQTDLQLALDGLQPLDSDLTAIAALTGNGLLRTFNGTWWIDTTIYMTDAHYAYGISAQNMIDLGNLSNTNSGDQQASDFNHDDLGASILTNAHIDWATPQTPDIHADNLPTHTHEGTVIDATGIADGHVLTADGLGNSAWEAVPAGGGEINDLSASVTWTNIPIANVPTGTTGTTVALGNHLHTGIYEPADAAIQTHIGTTGNPHGVTPTDLGLIIGTDVQAYSAEIDAVVAATEAAYFKKDGSRNITGELKTDVGTMTSMLTPAAGASGLILKTNELMDYNVDAGSEPIVFDSGGEKLFSIQYKYGEGAFTNQPSITLDFNDYNSSDFARIVRFRSGGTLGSFFFEDNLGNGSIGIFPSASAFAAFPNGALDIDLNPTPAQLSFSYDRGAKYWAVFYKSVDDEYYAPHGATLDLGNNKYIGNADGKWKNFYIQTNGLSYFGNNLESSITETGTWLEINPDVQAAGGRWVQTTGDHKITGAVTATTVNGVALTTGGSAAQFLSGDGSYQTLLESDISDLGAYLEAADSPTITGSWTFNGALNVNAITESTAAVGVTVDGVLHKDGTAYEGSTVDKKYVYESIFPIVYEDTVGLALTNFWSLGAGLSQSGSGYQVFIPVGYECHAIGINYKSLTITADGDIELMVDGTAEGINTRLTTVGGVDKSQTLEFTTPVALTSGQVIQPVTTTATAVGHASTVAIILRLRRT